MLTTWETDKLSFFFFLSFFFWFCFVLQYWGLNSGLHLEPPQPFFGEGFFFFFFFKIGSQELFAWAGFKPRSS
jgi:hypothetical protein